jgi:hypothetical protein
VVLLDPKTLAVTDERIVTSAEMDAGTQGVSITDLLVDCDDGVLAAGGFTKSLATSGQPLLAVGKMDALFAKLDPKLQTMRWATHYGGMGNLAGNVRLARNGQEQALYATGSFDAPISFEQFALVPTAGVYNYFIVKLVP